ncbi:MAG: hypothetical protein ACK5JT_08045, partial [Hyphomicrobiaceae bacterium]
GWECPVWFSDAPTSEASSEASCEAAAQSAVLFDLSASAKFGLFGPNAAAAIGKALTADVGVTSGAVRRSLMLTASGRVAADVSVLCRSAEDYLVMGDVARATLIHERLRRIVEVTPGTVLVDQTSAFAVLGLAGPHSDAILETVVEPGEWQADLAPGRGFETIAAMAPVWVLRQLDSDVVRWTVHVPCDYAVTLWDAVWQAGRDHGLVLGGRRALSWLHQQAGQPIWGDDFSIETSPFEAGLENAIDLDPKRDFIGLDALLAGQSKTPDMHFVKVISSDPAIRLSGQETIYLGEQRVGWTTSGGARQNGSAIATGYARLNGKNANGYAVDVRSKRVPVNILPLTANGRNADS